MTILHQRSEEIASQMEEDEDNTQPNISVRFSFTSLHRFFFTI